MCKLERGRKRGKERERGRMREELVLEIIFVGIYMESFTIILIFSKKSAENGIFL